MIKGGSIGKGTDLRDETKIELIFYVSGRHRLQAVAEQMEELLTVLEQYLQHYRECRFVRKTKQAVHVDLFCHGDHEHRVDILPVYDVLQAQSKREIYEDMTKSDTLRQFYSTCLIKLQQAFVKEQPERVKNLIRLVKYWRKSKLPADEGKNKWPDYYLLELITIRRWEEAGKPTTFDLRRGLYSVLHALVEYRDMKIQWLVNYDKIFMKQIRERNPAIHVPEIFKTPRAEGRIGTTAQKHKYPGYYVIDPANPFSNVASTCELWHKVAEVAGESLQMPLFGGLGRSGLHNW
ncbi:hypothetical protein CHS0354_026445 [Potamilus streckersoni]|uniref:2'-5'-oligoadenylate synthetase 1 domain-containing protein n=1 Tax=Potamilus streckersoni TaxID=2493646 RepID=A0AAE0RQ45_9BIVA|nr:hypothetical protein CHS0354_026445 [Potamilus streckersoni]